MRTLLLAMAMLAAVAVPSRAQERLSDQLRKGIVEEEAGQNLDKAIQAYQSIVARYDEDRKAAGAAMFRLAECYRKGGKREQAIAVYQRVTREFADQAAIAEPSRKQLASLGVTEPRDLPARAAGTREPRNWMVVAPDASMHSVQTSSGWLADGLEVTRAELEAAMKRLRDMQQRFELGQVTENAVLGARSEVVRLEQRIKQQEAEIALNQHTMQSVATEIKLVQEQIKALEAGVKAGKVAAGSTELLQLRRDLLGLQRRLDELTLNLKR